jgi:hypothetical protein
LTAILKQNLGEVPKVFYLYHNTKCQNTSTIVSPVQGSLGEYRENIEEVKGKIEKELMERIRSRPVTTCVDL